MPRVPLTWTPAAAEHQHGVFTTNQAVESGLTRQQVSYRLRTGAWVRVAGDGLVASGTPPTPLVMAWSAHLTWPAAVVCGPSAAAVYGAPEMPDDVVHVWDARHHRGRGRIAQHAFDLDPTQVVTAHSLHITKPRRSYLDTLRMLPHDSGRDLFAWLVTRRRLTRDDVVQELDRPAPRAWGNRRLLALLEATADGVLSAAERLLVDLLRRADITGWEANVPIHDAGGTVGWADVLFAPERLVIEVDGRRAHGPDRFQADRTRQNRLVAAGYTVLRFTWEDLTSRQAMVVHQITAMLTRLGSV